jgi:hypothetical protein
MSIDPELRKGICSITGGAEMLRKARKATKNLRRMKEEQVLVTRAKYLPQGNRTSYYKRKMLKSTHEIPADNMKCAHQTTNTRAASRKINRLGGKKNTKYKKTLTLARPEKDDLARSFSISYDSPFLFSRLKQTAVDRI